MKNIFLIILLNTTISCTAQIYSLRTFTDIPENAYEKDISNELPAYEGIWKGVWGNKTIFINFKKITNKYDQHFKYYRDYLIGKFKVLDSNGNLLFDNTNLTDDKAKIYGSGFRKTDDKYSLIYIDNDLCFTSGNIRINFTDSTKTKLNWNLYLDSNMITDECPYYNTVPFPEALPKEILLTKQ
ncbi:DUF6705 family protein [Chryseobacterium turcicum]|uniref:DUF6705 domain-containing protein n=1 Tax=Chryseobacterium turcicum TaxID=2898076 RepID=A0A9Q3YUC5_9FLAO|nr:DUF6705 family protein [Chryseobacterium turcicum]MCD1116216.1 hypothetical protein [Chryseobacterium turcicum]